MTKLTTIAAAVAVLSTVALGGAQAKDFYKMSTISLPTAFAINTTFAKVVQKYNPDIEIQVNATGKAPRHALDAARGKCATLTMRYRRRKAPCHCLQRRNRDNDLVRKPDNTHLQQRIPDRWQQANRYQRPSVSSACQVSARVP